MQTSAAGDPRLYFADHAEPDFGARLIAKIEEIETGDLISQVRSRISHAYQYYFGFDNDGIHATSGISRGGEQGELAQFRVNHARAVVGTLLNLVVSQRVVWQPKATNVDYESVKQTEVAKAVLEYYWNERKLESLVYRAVEEGIAFSEGFVLSLWDKGAGEDVAAPTAPEADPYGAALLNADADPEAPTAAKTGDFCFENVSSWDVLRDPRKKSWEALDWVIVRVYRNKFALAAQYPGFEEDILGCPTEIKSSNGRAARHTDNDDIPVYLFFHKRRPQLPDGREAVVLPNKTILEDGALSYDDIPLVRVAPAELTGTPFAYTQFFEILAIQELIDSLHSSAATNLTTFGTQNIWLPNGCEISPEQTPGGARIIQGGAEGKEPKAVQLCATPAELYKHLEDLKHDLEMVFGVNATVRGQIQSDKLSGAAMVQLETQAKQQSSGLHGSYRMAVQRLGDIVITEMRKRATTERTVAIVGKDSAFCVSQEQFTGDDFGEIKRVLVDIGNPLSQSVFGRAEQAKELVQMGLVNNLEQYFMLLDTGRAEPITQGLTNELMLIRSENEDISNGVTPEVMLHDNHLLHGREHRIPVASPQARKNPAVLKADIEHMHKHYEAYYGVPPMVPQVDPMTGMAATDPMTGEPLLAPEPMYRQRMLVLMGMQPPDPALGGIPPMAGMPDAGGGAGKGPPAQDAGQNTPAVPGKEPGNNERAKPPAPPKNLATGERRKPQDGLPPGPPAVA